MAGEERRGRPGGPGGRKGGPGAASEPVRGGDGRKSGPHCRFLRQGTETVQGERV